ncbi:MAG: small acid-soluble spore protein SspI [Bacilli bacterium]|nr:small acid-soluble spore protein SspI [Bacilli bacterium]
MKNISIRDYIISNFKDTDEKEMRKAIDTSIETKEEEALPGMGVFFEILWENSNEVNKKTIMNTISSNIKNVG